jgi:alanine-synthesizing transaminase
MARLPAHRDGAEARKGKPVECPISLMFSDRTQWTLQPNRLAELLQQRSDRRPYDDLTESNPTRCGFQFDEPAILAALSQPQALCYQPEPRGLESAREAVAAYYAARGERVDPQRIFLTSSTSEAYSYIFRLLANPGDQILAPRPSYPLFDLLGRLNDATLVDYPLVYQDHWQIDPLAFSRRITPRSRGVLVVTPNNPTGSFLSSHDRAMVLEHCARYGMAMIADEVFADFILEAGSAGPPSALADAREALSFTLNGLSKICALPQMKVAWLVVNGPKALADEAVKRLEIIADTYLSVSTPAALAVPALLASHHAIQRQILERLWVNLRQLDAALWPQSIVSRLKVEGGWYAVLRVPNVRSDELWALDLLEYSDVLVHPGHFFDFASEGFLVVSLLPRPSVFAGAMARTLDFIHRNS